MKIAILNISIGKYDVFWKDFYITAERNFLPNHSKHYFVFSDNENLYANNCNNVTVLFQDNLGWPFNTMKRFHMFRRISNELKDYDYVFFINGNALFNKPMTEKFINFDKSIITIAHPGLYGKKMDEMPFERNPKSNAFIGFGEGKFYVQGAFIGGKAKSFMELINLLDDLTNEDLDRGIIAVWHDESFLNKYVLNRQDVQVMGRQYLYYEEYTFPWQPMIILRNKRNHGNLSFFRGGNDSKEIKIRLLMKFKNIKDKLLIFFKITPWVENLNSNGEYIDIDLNIKGRF